MMVQKPNEELHMERRIFEVENPTEDPATV